MNGTEQNRRAHARTKALKGARIIFNQRQSAMNCTVRNLSKGGVKIVLDTPAPLPDQFDLRLADGTEYHCTVRWRGGTELGLEFTPA